MKARSKLLIGCGLMFLLLSACKRPYTLIKSNGELNTIVTWDGKSFAVTNRDTFDWQNVVLAVNLEAEDNVYLYPILTVKKGETIKVTAREFFRGSDRKKLNVKEVELITFTICEGDASIYNVIPRLWRGVIYEFR